MPQPQTHTISARHDFTPEELEAIGLRLADSIQEQAELGAEKKAVMSEFKERADTLARTVGTLARQRRDGFEMRPVECRLRRDHVRKVRQYVRLDTDEVVREEPFHADDYQANIFD